MTISGRILRRSHKSGSALLLLMIKILAQSNNDTLHTTPRKALFSMDSSSEHEISLPSVPLLTDEFTELQESKYHNSSRQNLHRWTKRSKSFNIWILVHVLLILSYSVLFFVTFRHSIQKETIGKLLPRMSCLVAPLQATDIYSSRSRSPQARVETVSNRA
jgi:hypothetical protein